MADKEAKPEPEEEPEVEEAELLPERIALSLIQVPDPTAPTIQEQQPGPPEGPPE